MTYFGGVIDLFNPIINEFFTKGYRKVTTSTSSPKTNLISTNFSISSHELHSPKMFPNYISNFGIY